MYTMSQQNGRHNFEVLLGPPGNYYYFEQEISERIAKTTSAEHNFIYLLPVKRATRHFKELLVRQSPHQAISEPPVFTFYEFILRLYAEFSQAKKLISPSMSLFLVEEALKRNEKDLRFFRHNSAVRRGLVRKVNELITELREYGYSSDRLLEKKQIGPEDEQQDIRIHDFSRLILTFQDLLGKDLIDESAALHDFFQFVDKNWWQSRFPQVDTIYMSGYGLFTQPMETFFQVFSEFCTIKIKLDYIEETIENEFPVIEHTARAYQFLQNSAPSVSSAGKAGPIEKLLFRHDAEISQPVPPGKDILIQPAMRRSEEIAFIAAYVKRLHLHKKIPLHKIGITFPSLEQYAPLIHQIFPRYGIPYNISTGYNLDQSPLIRALMLVLEIPLLGFPVKKLQQLLSSPFLNANSLTSGGHALPSETELKHFANQIRVTHFSGNWQTAFLNHCSYLENAPVRAQEEPEISQRLESQLLKIQAVGEGTQILIDAFQKLTEPGSASDFRQRYLTILSELGMLDWYKTPNREMSPRDIEQEYRAFNRFIKLIDQFSWTLNALPSSSDQNLEQFYQYLALLVTQATYNLREWPHFGLQIMPRLEIQSIEPEVLIFGGMLEGQFPRPFTNDIFFHDDEREKLGLLATEDLLDQDRYLFYQLLRSPTNRLVFTFPKFEKDNATIPSNFLNSLAERFQVRWRRNTPSANFIRTDQSLLEKVSGSILSGITPDDVIRIRDWKSLLVHDKKSRQRAKLWTHRVAQNHLKRYSTSFGIYEGNMCGHTSPLQKLRQEFSGAPFSVTRLESFAFCPIQFFFRYILHLQEEEESSEGMTALERGQVVHNTLFRFYRHLKQNGEEGHPASHIESLLSIAREEFEQLPFEGLFFDMELERYLGTDNSTGLFQLFVIKDQQAIDQLGTRPAFFELSFGQTGRKADQDPDSLETPIEFQHQGISVSLTGKIDRIDIDQNHHAVLIDYKTGAIGSGLPLLVSKGLSLQLPLYALAIEKMSTLKAGFPKLSPAILSLFQVRDFEISAGNWFL